MTRLNRHTTGTGLSAPLAAPNPRAGETGLVARLVRLLAGKPQRRRTLNG